MDTSFDEDENAVYGFIYGMSNNIQYPGYIKIGLTTRPIECRLREANKRKTFEIRQNNSCFKYDIVKYVKEPKKKEKALHTIIGKTYNRYEKSEFFFISLDDLKEYFDLIDGEYVELPSNKKNIQTNRCIIIDDSDDDIIEEKCITNSNTNSRRSMSKCLIDGIKIRHTINNHTVEGIYDAEYNDIEHFGEYYSLNKFVKQHYLFCNIQITNVNAWKECYYLDNNNQWISTFTLPIRS